jgi:hypothetical protein
VVRLSWRARSSEFKNTWIWFFHSALRFDRVASIGLPAGFQGFYVFNWKVTTFGSNSRFLKKEWVWKAWLKPAFCSRSIFRRFRNG